MKSKSFTVILAFLFGHLGLHRLYLRQYFRAFLYLAYPITLLTVIFAYSGFLEVLRDEGTSEALSTLLSFIPLFLIIPVFDGIWFLVMSKEKFNLRYNTRQKHATKEVYYSVGVLALGLLYNYLIFHFFYEKASLDLRHKADIEITAHDLAAAFGNNEEEAANEYGDKVLGISGVIEAIETQLAQDGEEKVLILTGDGNLTIRCEFKPEEQKKIADLTVGDEVSLKGSYREVMIFDVVLENCVLNE